MLRFAPSPAGDMHIGDLRVAIFNFIAAKQREEEFIVRMEDIDKNNVVEGKDQEILDTLALFGIEYSQVIHQSQNVRFHSAMALQLMHEKKAFSCFCSDAWLEKKVQEAKDAGKEYGYDDACRNLPAELVIDNTNPFTVRITRPDENVIIHDVVQGDVSFTPDEVDSFIIMNHDKTPTQDFASAVDDMLSDISFIVRDKINLLHTPKQEHVRNSLAYDKQLKYAHISSISNAKKFTIKQLLEEGYLPEAILNYLVSIGNSFTKEVFTINEAIEFVNLSQLNKDTVSFQLSDLRLINQKHLRDLEAKELSRYVGFADSEIGELARIYLLEDVATTKELKAKIAPIFKKRIIPDTLKEQVQTMQECITQAPYFQEYESFKKYVLEQTKLEDKDFEKSLRLLLTNAENGPELSQLYKYLKNYLGEIIK